MLPAMVRKRPAAAKIAHEGATPEAQTDPTHMSVQFPSEIKRGAAVRTVSSGNDGETSKLISESPSQCKTDSDAKLRCHCDIDRFHLGRL
jgi:hypothetical protein